MNLEGYVTVADRLRLALERYPELRVVEDDPELLTWPGGDVLLCRVRVYRTPDDPVPTVGAATEPIPGKTPYTRNSELMVGNTSALGRALGYLGLGIRDSIASRDEVETARNRGGGADDSGDRPEPRPARTAELGSRARQNPATPAQLGKLRALGYNGPSPESSAMASRLIDSLTRANESTEVR